MAFLFILCSTLGSLSGLVALRFPSTRWLLLLPITLFATLSLKYSVQFTGNGSYDSIVSMTVIIWYLHITSFLFLQPVSIAAYRPEPNWRGAWRMLFNGRLNNVPMTSSKEKSGPNPHRNASKEPAASRQSFLLSRALSLLSMYVFMVIYYDLINVPALVFDQFPPRPEDYSKLRTRVFFRRLPNVTAYEICFRSWGVYKSIFDEYWALTGAYYCLSIIGVGIGLEEREDWPALYGSLLDNATTVRGFWSGFDHRLAYHPLLAYARRITQLLGMQRARTSTYRYTVNFIVCFISGCFHMLHEWMYGEDCGLHWTLWWFCMQPLAMCFEAVVRSGLARSGLKVDARLKRLVGYCWVFAWMFWSLPKRFYQRCGPMPAVSAI